MVPRPALLRAAGWLRLVRVLALLVIVAFVIVAGYSATQLRIQGTPSGSSAASDATADAIHFRGQVNISNPGWLSFQAVGSTVLVTDPNGTPIGHGGGAPRDLPAGATSSLVIEYTVPTSVLAGEAYLATHDASLPVRVWVNGTYARLFAFSLSIGTNYTWGAPLFGLQAAPGSPTTGPNGTVVVPVTLAFADHAAFAVAGNATVRLVDGSGAPCASSVWPVSAAPGSSFSQSFEVVVPAGCSPSAVSITVRTAGWSYALPTEVVP